MSITNKFLSNAIRGAGIIAVIALAIYATQSLSVSASDQHIVGSPMSMASAQHTTARDFAKALLSNTTLLTNSYDNKASRYKIKYPSNWQYDASSEGTVVFSGKQGTLSSFSNINIQTIYTKKSGGDFARVQEFIAEIKRQAMNQSKDAKIIEHGSFVLDDPNGAPHRGEYLYFSYSDQGQTYKQWQIILLRNDEKVFYAWAYTSPEAQYPRDLSIAQHMLKTWKIY